MNTLDRGVLYIGVPLAVLLAALSFANLKELTRQPYHPPGALNAVPISLDYNGGNCKQNGATSTVDVPVGSYVTWTSTTVADSIDVKFPANQSPFYESVSPNVAGGTGAVQSGQAYGVKNNPYPYQSLTINNQPCNNPGQLGFIMR
jgi:hypothetical protein